MQSQLNNFFLFYQYHPAHVVATEFAVGATNCSAEEAKANVGACQLLPEDQSVSMAAHQPQSPQLWGRKAASRWDVLALEQE